MDGLTEELLGRGGGAGDVGPWRCECEGVF